MMKLKEKIIKSKVGVIVNLNYIVVSKYQENKKNINKPPHYMKDRENEKEKILLMKYGKIERELYNID